MPVKNATEVNVKYVVNESGEFTTLPAGHEVPEPMLEAECVVDFHWSETGPTIATTQLPKLHDNDEEPTDANTMVEFYKDGSVYRARNYYYEPEAPAQAQIPTGK